MRIELLGRNMVHIETNMAGSHFHLALQDVGPTKMTKVYYLNLSTTILEVNFTYPTDIRLVAALSRGPPPL